MKTKTTAAFVLIAALLLNGCQNSKERDAIISQSIYNMAIWQAERMASRINSDLQALKTVSNIMGEYENIPANQRRDWFDDMLLSVLNSEKSIVSIYTVWDPNAVDGMDARYKGRIGSTPTGQYAIAYGRETGKTIAKTYEEIMKSMAHIHGPDSRQVLVDPVPINLYGRDTYAVNMMVPIVNPRLDKVVGCVGFLWDIGAIQNVIEKTVKGL